MTPGLGWIVWRDASLLPRELIFELHYLGGTEQSYTLNFSRPGAQVAVQYYNLVHLGFAGYREVVENCLANARVLSRSLEATGWYTCVSDVHRRARAAGGEDGGETSAAYEPGLPVVSFRFSDAFAREFPHVRQETVSLLLRARQWIVPNYALPPGEDATEILRAVVRVSMSLDLLERLVADVVDVTEGLMRRDQVDLSILQEKGWTPRGPRVRGAAEGEEKKEEEGKKKKGRMADGIHRSVC